MPSARPRLARPAASGSRGSASSWLRMLFMLSPSLADVAACSISEGRGGHAAHVVGCGGSGAVVVST